MQYRTLKQSLLVGTGLLLSTAAFAHPSVEHHAGFVQGLWHLLSEPDHLLMLLGGLSLFWLVKHQTSAQRSKQNRGE